VHGVRYRALSLADLVDFYEAIWLEASVMGLTDIAKMEYELDLQCEAQLATAETWGTSPAAEAATRAMEEQFGPKGTRAT
jgi:hypothetical protein